MSLEMEAVVLISREAFRARVYRETRRDRAKDQPVKDEKIDEERDQQYSHCVHKQHPK